jgi:hypothetical protein
MHSIFYSTGSETGNPRQRGLSGLSLGLLSCVVLAFNAAGSLHTGLIGLLGLIFLFLLLGSIGCYWYIASVHLLAQWITVNPPSTHQRSKAWLNSLQGLWPLILLGPAVSAQRWWPSFGLLFTLSVLIGTGIALMLAIRRAYALSWPQAGFCFGTTFVLATLATLGLLGWPMMLFLGAKNFGPALMVFS